MHMHGTTHHTPMKSQPLSALDLLSINNLVNYFGKTEASDNVEVRADLYIFMYRERGI